MKPFFRGLVITIFLVCHLTFTVNAANDPIANDTASEAVTISSGKPVYAKIEHGKDDDWYKFEIKKEGTVRVSLENLPFDYEASLFDADSNNLYVLRKNYDNADQASMAEYEISDAGTYFIQVKSNGSYSSSKEYKLKVTYPSDTTVHDSSLEPNDTKENAYSVKSGKIYKATIDSSFDQDVYMLDVKKAGEIKVWIDNLPYDYRVVVYNEQFSELRTSLLTSWDHVSHTVKDKGRYYVVVYSPKNQYSEDTEYLFKATFPDKVSHDKSFEPNDTQETAYALTSGKPFNAKLEYQHDVDVYELKVAKKGQVRVNLENLPFSYSMELYNEKGNQLSGSFSKGKNAKYIDYNVNEAGSYFIHIKSYLKEYSKTKSYKILATFPTAKVTHNKKTMEPNDVREYAVSLKSGKSFKGIISTVTDEDYYKISVKKGEKISVTLSDLVYDYKLTIYDKDGKKLKDKTNWGKKPVELLYKAIESGVLYISVSPIKEEFSAKNPYKLYVLKSKYFKAIVNEVTSDSRLIGGEAEPNTTVYITANGKVLAQKKSTSTGYYYINIPKQKSKTKITVYTKDSKGNKSPTTTTVVK
ncbi:pre-peptidase C-terminal domain-containing protein [Bacillus sp. 31A1R]|uniref:Pre-peptidase C-terminal domain-containing protein n=1 Tax=Robertmurraya mangrovi TaxID=3098077 RepID=A0ABU5IXI9_9BACI|nr:pre-peptidase C-terminal domain-containing protein [Bacillus sp. 31A1R]MDZ5471889.1 pre-peptidase C-terminal domain-containing protein [Bacillus sp. 31A1R]